MLSFASAVKELLEAHVPILVYHGANDFIVNWLGGQSWTNALKWSGSTAFRRAPNETYMLSGTVVGSYKTASGLTFMKIDNAGHLVPMDQPAAALDMLNKFTAGKPW